MNRIKFEDIPLQPLRISKGWTVDYNEFTEIEPYSDIKVEGLPDEDVWELFLQDLLQLKHEAYGIIIDLGWTPEADPDGSYKLTVIENQDWHNPLFIYRSKNKDDIVEKINHWLSKITYQLDKV